MSVNSNARKFRATFPIRSTHFPVTVSFGGVYYRCELKGTPPDESGALPPDLFCGLNLAKAHLRFANGILGLAGKMTLRCRAALCRAAECNAQGNVDQRVRYLVFEILRMSGAEVIRELYPNDSSAHRAAYTAALQIAEEARHGLPFSISQQELKRLETAAEDEAWAAARPSSSPPPRRLSVDLAKKTITLDGNEYPVRSESALRWVKVLADRPGVWISSTDLKGYDEELDGVRTDRLRLPPEIASLIESRDGPGGGSRILTSMNIP